VLTQDGVIDRDVTEFGEGDDRNVGPHLGFQGIVGLRSCYEQAGGDCKSSATAFHCCHHEFLSVCRTAALIWIMHTRTGMQSEKSEVSSTPSNTASPLITNELLRLRSAASDISG
jgi:hypothetical protein